MKNLDLRLKAFLLMLCLILGVSVLVILIYFICTMVSFGKYVPLAFFACLGAWYIYKEIYEYISDKNNTKN